MKSAGYFIYRRPHSSFYCYEGDEMNLFGDYDFTFKLPPVPFEGDWQIRLGFTSEPTRGIGQIYFDDVPQGIPLDMTKSLADPTILGTAFRSDYTSAMSSSEKLEERKALKNKGYYRGAAGGYHLLGDRHDIFAMVNPLTVLCFVRCISILTRTISCVSATFRTTAARSSCSIIWNWCPRAYMA